MQAKRELLEEKPNFQNMDELLKQISSNLLKNDTDRILMSGCDIDYAYGQLKVAHETSKQCNFKITGEQNKRYYCFRKKLNGPADMPTLFQEKIYTFYHRTAVWFDDIAVVTRGTKNISQNSWNLYSQT